MKNKIYLDNNATTALDEQVLKVIEADLRAPPSNPSSIHFLGREAKDKLQMARQSLASFFHVKPQEILFTSGGTESMNSLLKGLIDPRKRPHILTSNIEHSCVEKTLKDLEKQGCSVTFLPAGLKGSVSLEQLQEAITPETKYLVFGAANSETGVTHDIKAFASFALSHNIPLIVDAIAHFGKEPFPLYPGIGAAGFSAHKFHGPKGAGFMFLRSPLRAHFTPLLLGGGQESGLRSGTENLTAILGLAEAVRQVEKHLPTASIHMQKLRDHFEKIIQEQLPFVQINGTNQRICNVSNLCFPGYDAETLCIQLDLHGIAASQGSACSSGSVEPSRVLTSMGLSQTLAKASLRFSLSRLTTQEEIETAASILVALVKKL
ncbi:MAG: cysteine desulfurase [Rhabdochlamydiaceae bacterium]|nr:cysteine desulfurase [Rhabdochlamydiaceae bacterium]